MRLSRLEIAGFKSFPDPTVVLFPAGISALVGPNGCGKSNLAEAILWALGEQSPRSLRSERMEDVIFNGTASRKALGVAEVTLTFADLDGALPPPYATYSELSVSRCLYRSGECDYFINKSPARLKDIRDLLIDAGAGARAHNIIEQGKVDQLVSASPMQMREIVEETAGIAKYRIRKAEALRKMDATEQNLARVRDIIAEVRKQLQSLDRQARKAEKYRQLRAELRGLELAIASAEWQRWRETLDRLSRERAALEATAARWEAERTVLDLKQSKMRLHLAENARILETLQSGIFEIETAIRQEEGAISTLRVRQQQWRETAAQTAQEVEEIERSLARVREEEKGLQRQLDEIDNDLPTQSAALSVQQAQIAERERALSEKTAEVERARRRTFEQATRLAEVRNHLAQLVMRMEEIERWQVRGSAEAADIAKRQGDLLSQIEALSVRLSETRTQQAAAAASQSACAARLTEAESSLKSLRLQLAGLKESAAKTLAERASREGFYRAWLPTSEGKSGSDAGGTAGQIVADLIEVPAAYEIAVESVLEGRLRARIAAGHLDIQAQVVALSKNRQGRETFVLRRPRLSDETDRRLLPPLPAADGVIGAALDLIGCRAGFESVATMLLGDVVIVSDFETACRLWEKENRPQTWVTLSGEVIDASGTVMAGAPGEAGLLELKREIRALSETYDRLQGEIDGLEIDIATQEADRQTAQAEWAMQAAALRALEMRQIEETKDHAAQTAEMARLKTAAETLLLEREQREAEKATIRATHDAQTAEMGGLQAEWSAAESALQELQAAQDAARSALHADREEETRLKMAVASLTERRRHLQERQSGVVKTQAVLQAQVEQKTKLQRDLVEKDRDAEAEIAAYTKAVQQKSAERDVQVEQRKVAQAAHREMQEAEEALSAEMATLRVEIEQTQKAIQETALSIMQADLSAQQIQETIRTHYQIEIDTYVPPTPEPTATSDSHAGVASETVSTPEASEEVSPAESAAPSEPPEAPETPVVDDTVRKRAAALRQMIDNMGPVNVGAIEEYQELDTRYQFLTTQEADLSSSLASLRETIAKINTTTRGLFVETFHRLNEKFQEVFATFFSGGRAELVLLEADQPLDSGIELVVEPPGKRPRGIGLLSGGEKALTAISLLFATFLLRPGPFCLMDEVDASLDEENTRRFATTLSRMAERIQFIVITHNKRTMEVAGALYGVTMQEAGVSTLVSVNLAEADRFRHPA